MLTGSLTAIYFFLFKDVADLLTLQLRLTRGLRPLVRYAITSRDNSLLILNGPVSRKMVADASAEDREHRLFHIATALNGTEALAAHIVEKFNLRKEEVAALKAIHDVHKQGFISLSSRLGLPALIGICLAAGSIVFAQMPKEVVEYLGWSYPRFRVAISVMLLVLAVLVILFWLWRGKYLHQSGKTTKVVDAALAYCDWFCSSQEPTGSSEGRKATRRRLRQRFQTLGRPAVARTLEPPPRRTWARARRSEPPVAAGRPAAAHRRRLYRRQ